MTHPAAATMSRVAALQTAWPDHVRLTLPDLPRKPPQVSLDDAQIHWIYAYHAYLFAGAFPDVGEQEIAQLSMGAYLFTHVLTSVDRIVDEDSSDPVGGPLDMMAGQFEAYRALARLFPGESPFWDVLRTALVDYTMVVREQRRFAAGERAITDFSYPLAADFAKAKSSPATVTVAGLGELARTPEPVEALARSVHAYSIATIVLDDLMDWRADLAARRPSYPLAQALSAAGVVDTGQPWTAEQTEQIGRAFYFGGVIAKTVDLVVDEIAQARAAASELGVEGWLERMDYVATSARAFGAQVSNKISNTGRDPRRPGLSIKFSVDHRRPWQSLAFRSLRWLLSQWRLGFVDANHVMRFPGMPNPGPHMGNVLSRALIANVLAEANRGLAKGQLQPCLDAEVDHLLAIRRTGEPGMWAYLPELTDLPCDAEDLAEALRVLTRTGRAEEFVSELTAALAVAFDDGGHPDGSFDTWLIPRGESPDWAVAQTALLQQRWGEGTDPEVVANLLHAVAGYAPQRYQDTLDRGVSYLLSAQADEGWWPSDRYQGRLYGTHQCMRTIALLRPTAIDTLNRAHNYVLAAQRDDGGWANTGQASDPLGTALALLILAQAQERGLDGGSDRADAVRRAQQWLADNADANGSYPQEPFIALPHRASSLGDEPGFGSRNLTTALVCQAALTWDRLS